MVGDTAPKHEIKICVPTSVGWSAAFQLLAEMLMSGAAFVCRSCTTIGNRQHHWTMLPLLRNQQPQTKENLTSGADKFSLTQM